MIKINCDLCGKTEEGLVRALIEGVELNVCPACGKFGKILGIIKKPDIQKRAPKRIEEEKEVLELIVEEYPSIIKNKRESLGMTQKDFASKINEKESTVHKIETGHMEPSISLVKKLEKVLGIKLVEQHEEKHERVKRGKEEGFTLGDFIKIKK